MKNFTKPAMPVIGKAYHGSMTFDQLRVFIAVAEQLSFTRAAELLYLSQPAVSQHVQGLERHFGQALFERKGRRLELTVAGARLLSHARRIMQEAAEATEALSELDGQLHGRIHVGASETVGCYLLPGILGPFLADHPLVQIALRLKSTPDVISALVNGELDLGVVEEQAASRYRDQLVTHFFRQGQVVLVVAPDHPWAARPEVDPQELVDMPLVVRPESDRTRAFWSDKLAQAGVYQDALTIGMELDDTEGIKRAVMAGLGAGFVSLYAVEQELARGDLRSVTLRGLDLSRPLWVVTPVRRQLPLRLQALLECLQGHGQARV